MYERDFFLAIGFIFAVKSTAVTIEGSGGAMVSIRLRIVKGCFPRGAK